MTRPLDIVVLGLSLSSSWGNGHATTWRALLKGLAEAGHSVTFLERDVPWYAAHRDLARPEFCELAFYSGVDALASVHRRRIANADLVIVGSYVPDGIEVLDSVFALRDGPVAFYDIDTPVTLAALRQSRCEFLAPRQIPDLSLYFSFSGGEALRRLDQEFGARRPIALYCAVDETSYRPLPGTAMRWDLGYLGTYSPDRQPALERLLLEPARALPDRRFVVAGPQYPDDIDWPANVERLDHVGPQDHPAFYAAQRHTLNITRADMIALGHSPSVRLFEAAACGTPIISDRWEGLGELLPEGKALLIADDSAAVIGALEHEPDGAAQARAAEARRIVLRGHTGRARADQLVAAFAALGRAESRPGAATSDLLTATSA